MNFLGFWERFTAFFVLLAFVPSLAARGGERFVEREFEESFEFVRNPDCGWVAYNYEDSYDLRRRSAGGKEPFALASVIYTRRPRVAWETPEGRFERSSPTELLKDWMAHERYVAFRVYANRVNQLPTALRGKVQSVGEDGKRIAYWDQDYIEDHRNLVEYLGKQLGSSPYLAFVDIGGVGDTGGEWYFSRREPYDRAGLDSDRYFQLVEAFVGMYRKAFPATRLFISYDCVTHAGERSEDVVSLLATHNVGVRDDGLGGWPYPREHPPVGAWPVPLFWRNVPVLFEGAGKGGGVFGWVLQGKDPERVLDWAFERCHPSYLNIGGSESVSEKACADLTDILIKYGSKLGYRLTLLSARVPATFGKRQICELKMRWANRGIAPCYENRQVEVSFLDAVGRLMASTTVQPVPPTTEWGPGTVLEASASFAVPPELDPGDYALKIRMLLGAPFGASKPLAVATRGADAAGRYTVGRVTVY